MKELKHTIYGVVGLGIMGGAIVKAIRAHILDESGATGKVYASNRSKAPLSMASAEGMIDKGFALEDVAQMLSLCDVVYVCLYPDATLQFIKDHRDDFKSGAIVTDISGVKTALVEGLPDGIRPDVDFVVGHPMAGGEKEGYINSKASFFINRNYILMPQPYNTEEHLEFMKQLITAMGFTRIVETEYKNHDHKIAFTSQLCHVIASALVQSAEDERITEFGGGSYEDLTRIAMINAPLWTELFMADKKELLTHIDAFITQLQVIKQDLETEDALHLEKYLEEVRSKRMKMSRIDSIRKV
ncbi:MAG: prephenate dehydrogenase [Treponema sp.]|nr:prephenate dehydrogenase [Treponema sp.]